MTANDPSAIDERITATMRSASPKCLAATLPIIALVWIEVVGSERAFAGSVLPAASVGSADMSGGNVLPTASIVVEDAYGAPVEGAVTCIGTVMNPGKYGRAATNAFGIAFFFEPLPEGPATIYFTAGKDGRGAQDTQSYATVTVPQILTARIRLPASPGGTVCPAEPRDRSP